ncbi:hypothetical protein Back11_21230 [Paenibacillus baekrokdamisoli]|uniref:Peptidase S11 D-alanyl-D-alanine carboxypeptidase A N-terminal domain-containing protein n=1 Tax=Paenibacillus baekrokdamisoli TaxID=1712516 RepID=A0A3G9JA57_9BACL|nr:hypothetical protein Back11_21230 [Paenibacillus baekrokdamisoli]
MVNAARLRQLFKYAILLLMVYALLMNWGSMRIKAADVLQSLSTIPIHNGQPQMAALEAESALLMDEKTGAILFSKNAHKRLYPASTTKILTAIIALEKGNPNDMVTVGDEIQLMVAGESSAGLFEGERLSLKDLIAAMLLPSGNDAARTIARYVVSKEEGKTVSAAVSMEQFANLMNEKAQALGAEESHFVNPQGSHDPDHYTTAYDLAIIAKEARKNKLFRTLVSETEHQIDAGKLTQTVINRNKLLQPDSGFYYKGTSGIKTGFTDEAGYCVVASASRKSKDLIAVVLHSTATGVWNDAEILLQAGFDMN